MQFVEPLLDFRQLRLRIVGRVDLGATGRFYAALKRQCPQEADSQIRTGIGNDDPTFVEDEEVT